MTQFVQGKRYQAKQDIDPAYGSTFRCDEVVVFTRSAYSRYDECEVLEFVSEQTDQWKDLWLCSNMNLETARGLFREL
jgi:hypothetical protein